MSNQDYENTIAHLDERIDQLKAENAKLRKALTYIQHMSTTPLITDIAETALAGDE